MTASRSLHEAEPPPPAVDVARVRWPIAAWAVLRWAGTVTAGVSLPFAVVLATGRTFVWRETAKLFEPMRVLVADAIRALRLPLWNPHEALGMPLFAQ